MDDLTNYLSIEWLLLKNTVRISFHDRHEK